MGGSEPLKAQHDSLLGAHNHLLFPKHDCFAMVARYNWVSHHSHTPYLEQAVPHKPQGPGIKPASLFLLGASQVTTVSGLLKVTDALELRRKGNRLYPLPTEAPGPSVRLLQRPDTGKNNVK